MFVYFGYFKYVCIYIYICVQKTRFRKNMKKLHLTGLILLNIDVRNIINRFSKNKED